MDHAQSSLSRYVKSYLQLTKPGIVFGNLVTTVGGFALHGKINLLLLLTLVGIALVMAAGCVLNNCIDRISDAKMYRTRNRPLVQGSLSLSQAVVFGTALALLGFACLILHTNLLTTSIALLGFTIYPFVYSWLKMRTIYATHVGSIAGAVPPLVGYTAAGGSLDLGALLLFLIVALWQMPHFFAIAIYRGKEYASASIPVFPAIKGIATTKRHMRQYIVAFVLAVACLGNGLTLLLVVPSGLGWLAIKGATPEQWARRMFVYSLFVITLLSITNLFN